MRWLTLLTKLPSTPTRQHREGVWRNLYRKEPIRPHGADRMHAVLKQST